ncbi:MAG TPA: hypothetical protein VG225_09940 [Terracidiphilus sp.]|nr:hypothetical protein [Terracidiphilus sp.]
MDKTWMWMRNGLALVGVLAIGFWLGSGRIVKASSYESSGGVQFQLTGINESSSLLVYKPEAKTVYVYRGATTGNSALQCSYMFQLDRPGEVIRRVPCSMQSLIQ